MIWSVMLLLTTISCFQVSTDCITNALNQLNGSAEGEESKGDCILIKGVENNTVKHITVSPTADHDPTSNMPGNPKEKEGCVVVNNYITPDPIGCNCNNSTNNSQENNILQKVEQIHDQLLRYHEQTNVIQHHCSTNCAQKRDLDKIEDLLITTIVGMNVNQCDCDTKNDFSQIKRNRRTPGKYVGCYDSKKEPRGSVRRCKSNTISSCVDICYQGHFVYAELQNGYLFSFTVVFLSIFKYFF